MTGTARRAAPTLDDTPGAPAAARVGERPAGRAPTLEAARRAADALVGAGVREVWLYGSVARGESHRSSDIDLVAVFDDLDYRRRIRTTIDLQRLAEEACGHRVQVMATDRPEWRIQREQVSASFASAISYDLTLLACSTAVGVPVDWGKKQVAATSNEELAIERLQSALLSLDKINANRSPSPAEQEFTDTDDPVDCLEARGARLILVCEAAGMAIENAAKAVAVLSGVKAETLWSHDVDKIVGALDDDDETAIRALIASAPAPVKSAGYITMWRTVGVYGTSGEGMTVYELATPAFSTAIALMACQAAGHAAERASTDIARCDLSDKLRLRASALLNRLTAFDIASGEPVR